LQPDVRREDLAEHQHMLGDDYYWAGDYARSLSLARAARDTATGDPTSAEAMLRGTGMEAMVLAGLGQYDEALTKFDAVLALADEMGRPRRVMTNYSTLLFRELFDLREAGERSEWVLDGFPRTSFHMPWMNAEADLIHVAVLAAEWGAAQARWDRLYPQVIETPAWERWLLGGKLATFRAEIALATGDLAAAAEWGAKAAESGKSSGRVKYELAARDVLGRALSRLGRADESRQHLIAATDAADRLGNPHGRLLVHAHAALTLYAIGDDDAAATHHAAAQRVVEQVAAGLRADRAEAFRAAAPLPSLGDYR
jgi:tetratricopeptide (TPR) repeat protein